MKSMTMSMAKFAAVLAAAGLVLGSFAMVAPARAQSVESLEAQITKLLAEIAALKGGAAASMTFTRDLTVGATGTDVSALQTWLIKGGYSIPAGATGYFGAQTKAAVAAYQAANGIAPAAGYFGPVTRAKVNASGSVTTPTTPTNPTTPTPGLSGGEGQLNGIDNITRDVESTVNEDETENVLGIEVEAEDSDMALERVDVEFTLQDADTSQSDNIDDYITEVSLVLDGKTIATMDVDEADENDAVTSGEFGTDADENDIYSFRFTGLNGVIEEDETAELYVQVTAVNNIDSTDATGDWYVIIPDDGIRAIDAEGNSETYVNGSEVEAEIFRVGAAEVGELSLSESDEDPNGSILVASDDETSEEFTVFIFTMENDDEEDVLVTDITIDVATTTAVNSPATDIRDIIESATLMIDGEEYDGDINAATIDFDDIDVTIGQDEEVDVELVIELLSQDGNFGATGEGLTFSLDANDVDAEGLTTDDVATVSGSADGNAHTISLDGIVVEAVEEESTAYPEEGYATYSLEFSITALEDNAFIYNGAASTTLGATVGFVYDIVGSTWAAGGVESAVVTSSAAMSGNYFRVDEGETETFTLTLTLDPGAAGTYGLELESIGFDDDASAFDVTYTVDADDQDFETDLEYIPAS